MSAANLDQVVRARRAVVDGALRAIADGATWLKCCPPIRGAANRDALRAGSRNGQIDCVASDHAPCNRGTEAGDFAEAWGGIAALQLGLSAVWTAGRRLGRRAS